MIVVDITADESALGGKTRVAVAAIEHRDVVPEPNGLVHALEADFAGAADVENAHGTVDFSGGGTWPGTRAGPCNVPVQARSKLRLCGLREMMHHLGMRALPNPTCILCGGSAVIRRAFDDLAARDCDCERCGKYRVKVVDEPRLRMADKPLGPTLRSTIVRQNTRGFRLSLPGLGRTPLARDPGSGMRDARNGGQSERLCSRLTD